METNEPQSEATRWLYGLAARLVVIGWWVSRCVGFPVFICVLLSVLGDFLQAPLGFKEPPLHHGAVVDLARMALWPLIIAVAVLSFLQEYVEDWRAKSAKVYRTFTPQAAEHPRRQSMKSPKISEQELAQKHADMELLSRGGHTITSSTRTPDGRWLHEASVQPGATIFSRVPRPDKDA